MAWLGNLKIELSQPDRWAAQTQAIDERLAYLGQTALRQGKQDWAHIATGAIFTIAMSLSLDRDRAEKLLAMTSDFLNTIFRQLLT